MKIVLILCPSWGIETPHLGIALLVANLRKYGYQVKVRDFNIRIHNRDKEKGLWKSEEDVHWENEESLRRFIENNDQILNSFAEEVLATESEVIGFSVYNTTKRLSLELARRIKQKDKSKIIICGGQMCFPKPAAESIVREPVVDAVVMGEGDETIVNLMEKITELGKPGPCSGVLYKDKGKIIDCGMASPIMDMDKLPHPDFTDFDLKLYDNPTQLPILSGRGCPYQCAFCNTKLFWIKYRSMSGDRIFQEVLYQLNKYKGVHFFTFNDHSINANMKALSRFVELVIEFKAKNAEKKINCSQLSWRGAAVIREEMVKEFIQKLKLSGCIELEFGIESASNRVRKLMKKPPDDIKVVERVIRDTTEVGIGVRANFMFGFPGEGEEDFQETLEFLKRNKSYFVQVHPSETFCHIDPDTYMYNHAEEFGITNYRNNSLFWESIDGKNIYPVRLHRHQVFCQLANSLKIPLSPGGHKIMLYKEQFLKDYSNYERSQRQSEHPSSRSKKINTVAERMNDMESKNSKIVFNWHLLYKCNYRCPYCFYYGKWQDLPEIEEEASLEKWLKAWHRIYQKFGSTKIEMTGGEPFIYPAFFDLLKALCKEHTVSIVTNLSCGLERLNNIVDQIGSSRLKMCLSFHPLFADFDAFLKKALFLKEKGISDRVLYVTYPPQLKNIDYFKEKFVEKGIKFVAVPFRGKYQGVTYPEGYKEKEENIIFDFSKDLDEVQKRWVKDQVIRERTKGKLCRAGQEYVHIAMDGTAYRCSWGKGDSHPIGSLFDENFRPLNEALPCESESCPCDSKWLVEEDNHRRATRSTEILPNQKMTKKEKKITSLSKVKYRKFGKSEIMVSEIGIGGHEYGRDGAEKYQPFEERVKLIAKALELGINYFDTCCDTEGFSLGKVLKALNARDKCYIAYGENVEGFRIYSADERLIRETLERQLQCLQTDRIDIFRVLDFSISDFTEKMRLDKGEEITKIAHILSKFKKEGKIRFSCYSTHLYDQLNPLAGDADIGNLFDAIQMRYNFMENGASQKIIPYAKKHNMGIVVMKPFRKGTLLNRYSGVSSDATYADLKSPEDPLFANLKYKEKGMAYALLKFILSNPDISVVIPGVASIEQLIENANVSMLD